PARPAAAPAWCRRSRGSNDSAAIPASLVLASAPGSLPQLLPGVFHQLQAQVSQLRQVFLAKSFREMVLVLDAFLPDRLDPNAAGLGQVGSHRTAIVRVRHTLDEAVSLEVVDQTRDVAWR